MKTVLVVEDEKSLAEILKKRLESEGFGALIAYNGVEGIEMLKDNKVDLILLDILLPKMSGTTFLSKLKGTQYEGIPVIVLTNLDPVAIQPSTVEVLIKSKTSLDMVVEKIRIHTGVRESKSEKK